MVERLEKHDLDEIKREVLEMSGLFDDKIAERLEGDLDFRDIQTYFKERGKPITANTARTYMKELASKPGWELMRVHDIVTRRSIFIVRKVDGDES